MTGLPRPADQVRPTQQRRPHLPDYWRRDALTGVDALTPSERRVAQLAASGLGNREIAQALFVTTKTVETHLAAAYRKLGIAGRPELAEALG